MNAHALRIALVLTALWLAPAAIGRRSLAAAPPAAVPPADSRDQVGTLASGKTFRGQLIAAEEGRLTFRVAGGDRPASENVPIAQLVRWGQFVETSHGAQLLLADGGLLVGQLLAIDQGRVSVRSDSLGEVVLPAGLVRTVLVHPPADSRRRDQLLAGLAPDAGQADDADTATAPPAGRAGGEGASRDRVSLDNGDQLEGTILRWRDDTLSIETDAGTVELEAPRVAAIRFRGPAAGDRRPAGRQVLVVGSSDGSRLCATRLAAGATQAELTLAGPASSAAGEKSAAPVVVKLGTGAIDALQTIGGEAIYLADLDPAGYKHIPFLQLSWPYQVDRNAAGDLLRVGGKLFLKGLGMHSASRLTYDLERPASRLEATLAIDDRAGGGGSVVFRVFVDTGGGQWEPKFTSPTIRGGDPPLPITVDVTKAKRISLLVEFADRGDQLDYADWLDARLIP
jgi:hypothetical protein